MTNNIHLPPKDQREEKHNILIEVSEKEKQLVMLIHTKGPLHTDVRDLYRKVRSCYEKIIMCDNEQCEVQDLEYCLWKLHYKHIDEFRKRTKTKLGEQHNASHVEGFELFLSEATEFYQNLIAKIRKCYRLPDESSFYRRGDVASFPEPKKIKQCHFLCHRFLVCLGDLARYREQYEKPDARDHNWSMAATYYLEATAIWPDSGNPQNQLAVLATYVGDEFLALYHCIRSLAVKEPFPDARDNLTVLLERNRSSSPPPLPTEARFDFLKPSDRFTAATNFKPSNGFLFGRALRSENNGSAATDVWSLFIRLISFFFIKSNFDDFPSVFGLIMRELDNLMELDDSKLKASLESYRQMDSVKTGPFRALQAVSIFLYTLQNLINQPPQQVKAFDDADNVKPTVLGQWAMPAALIFMGRFVERCSKAQALSSCPLLPAVLVFAEWLASKFEEAEKCLVNEKNRAAMSYFFSSFGDLLKELGVDKSRAYPSEKTPLWEDYELRGFTPVASTHEPLDFSLRWECVDGFEKGIEYRASRVAATGLIIRNKSGEKFMTAQTAVEEEDEEILFSPLPRYEPAPPPPPGPPPKEAEAPLLDPSAQLELVFQNSPPAVSAGPPSLSAWVVDGENLISVAKKHALAGIDESASKSLYGLSIAADHSSSPSPLITIPSAPSAPLLPDDAAWYAASIAPAPAPAPNSWTAAVPAEYAPPPHHQRQMTSSEWLRHYLQTHHHLVDRGSSTQASPTALLPWTWPGYYYTPGVTMQVETPVYGGGYQRGSPYVCGAVTDMMIAEPQPQPLLQYLKERERQLQLQAHNINNPAFLG